MQYKYIISAIIPPLSEPFDYYSNCTEVEVGWKVLVPLRNRTEVGYVIKKESNTFRKLPYQIKPIFETSLNAKVFLPNQLNFFDWIAKYYGASLAEVFETAIPDQLQDSPNIKVSLQNSNYASKGKVISQIIDLLKLDSECSYQQLKSVSPRINTVLKNLESKGVIKITETSKLDSISKVNYTGFNKTLNQEQLNAFNTISSSLLENKFQTYLLHGVTGSGKTEVYFKAIDQALKQNKGALLIVPEIALTPQLVNRFTECFGNTVAILHSGVNKKERFNAWQALLTGHNRVAIGARSAIFAPINNLGIIIVDEEHDGSFKQSDRLCYHARDLAILRGKLENCPVILGSATPSLETLYNANQKKYQYLKLNSRYIANNQVNIEIIDLREQKSKDLPSKNISSTLYNKIKNALDQKSQSFIMYNKLGFASFLQCEKCGEVVHCQNCSVTLKFYQKKNSLVCHYCGLTKPAPKFCEQCGRTTNGNISKDHLSVPGKLIQIGAGTEKIYEELRTLFPIASIDRLDRQVAKSFKTYQSILEKVKNNQTDILLGTQLIAKGHDMPNVSLVGVVDCDIGLHLPDFRASEKVFQLLTQVAGRAGRAGQDSQVILQTRKPENVCLQMTKNQDYLGFTESELKVRADLYLPPFCKLLRILIGSLDRQKGFLIAKQIFQILKNSKSNQGLIILGPAQAPIEKLRNKWRWQILIKSKNASILSNLIVQIKSSIKKQTGVQVRYDLDPQDML